MDLIVTHKNADFDALSSLIAASKLYPGARLLLPGSQEKAVRNFMALVKDKIRIENEKTCRLDDVKRVILVDNRHRSRIGVSASLLSKKKIKIHIYDHHPRTRYDVKGEKDVFKEVGATVTLLLEILDKKGKLKLSPLEATIMLLGIYEETGSLSYRTTTKLDVDMVSKLLAQGANLNAVSLYLNRELAGSELGALIKLLETTEIVNVNGINIAFSQIEAKSFDGEMGAVVHKLQDVENFPVLFAMFKSGDKIKILARSRLEFIDVNKLLGHFGGAGHSSAAGAKIVGKSLLQIKEELLHLLKHIAKPEAYAKDIMSSPVLTVSQEERVVDVKEKLKKKGFKGAPVVDSKGKLTGIITLGDIKKAVVHNLGHSRVKGYMATKLRTVSPDTPLFKLQEYMIEEDKGRIPVVKKGQIVGIVTRTDVLRRIHSSLFEKKRGRAKEGTDLSKKIKAQLPKKLMMFILEIAGEADKRGITIFLVGGFVRDILLGEKNYDLDIVVEGDAIGFGNILKEKLGGSLVVHKKFGTATLVRDWPKWLGPPLHPDNKFKIDIATARKEIYKKPAALPTVRFSSLREDLYRRDFTINAMAVCINKKNFGQLIDFFGGIKDLKKGIIRILHDKSFIDDPTRIFRAVRFEQRFSFRIENHTEYLIQHAIKQEMFKRTENQRIREELILILKEEHPEKAVFRMRELHELRFIHPKLILARSIGKTFKNLRAAIQWYLSTESVKKRKLDVWLINFMAILDSLTVKQADEVLEKFVFTRSERIRLHSLKKYGRTALKKLSASKKIAPSIVYRSLEPLSHEVVLYLMAKTSSKTAQRRIRKFFTDYNGTRLKIRGHDIQKEGIKPGPKYRNILRKVLYKKVDGKLSTKQDELKYLKKLIKGVR